MEASEIPIEPVAPPADGNGGAPDTGESWQRQRDEREFVPKPGGKGKIFRQGEETVAQARARDAIPPEDRRPRRKTKLPPKPRGPSKVDLKELEQALAMGLKAPGDLLRAAGDEWGAQHFNNAGPYLARCLIAAAEANPWLREKLERAASGEQVMVQVITLMGLAGGVFMYTVPPVIYYMNLPISDERRAVLGVPPRRLPEPPPNAPEPPPDQPSQYAFGPEAAAAPTA